MMKVIECLAVIIATLIGAGFASGQEINSFFLKYGIEGSYGIVIVSLGWGITIVLLLLKIQSQTESAYQTLIHHNMLMNSFTSLYSFAVFCMMISSIGALTEQEFGINRWCGILIAEMICFWCFHYRLKLLKIISMIIVPFLIVGLIRVSSGTILPARFGIERSFLSVDSFIGALLYYSYNISILIPILCAFHEKKFNTTEIIWMGGVITLLMGWLMLRVYQINSYFYPNILSIELPNMYIASLISKSFQKVFLFVLIGAIYTTALTTRI